MMATNLDTNGLNPAALEPMEGSPQSRSDAGAHATDGDRVQELTARTAELVDSINVNLTDAGGRHDSDDVKLKNKYLIWSHINSCYGLRPTLEEAAAANGGTNTNARKAVENLQIKNPINIDFDTGFEWINTEVVPNLVEESTRSIIVLEFFTHCCINCIHSIEDVRQVYNKINARLLRDSEIHNGCRIKIISVHSPKFTREKDTDSIRAFVKRNRMTHTDVVNDPDCKLWNAFNIYCWPTLLIFGPSPRQPQQGTPAKLNLIFTLVGEGKGHKEILENLLQNSLDFFNLKIDFSQVQNVSPAQAISATIKEVSPEPNQAALRFPGKVVLYHDQLVISDSGNNRIVLCTTEGHVKEIVGDIESGYADGDFTTARFYNPQGVAFHDESVFYVADTGNHCVRKIDLKTKTVSTIVEPQASTAGDNGQVLNLKSPWDVQFYGKDVLLIAAAGNHQIFCHTFAPVQLFSVARLPNSFDLVAGTGKEENRNNMYIRKASFCQPSGICVSQGQDDNDKVIYVADSESSTIRAINSAGRVQPFVGGTKDPTDLFAYGDADGCGYDVRLQHPVGVCSAAGSTKVFIADTYNHKVKMIDRDTKHCSTLIGNGTTGNACGVFTGHVTPRKRSNSPSQPKAQEQFALLNEPNGISIDPDQNVLYIADTNNHCIKVANLKTRIVTELKLSLSEQCPTSSIKTGASSTSTTVTEKFDQDYFIKFSSDASAFNIQLNIKNLPANLEGGEWKLVPYYEKTAIKSGILTTATAGVGTALIEDLQMPDNSNTLLQVNIFFCGSSSCYRKTLKFRLMAEVGDAIDAAAAGVNATEPFMLEYYPPEDFFKEN